MFQCDIEGLSIVLLGAFNPSIFTPDWFGREGLLNAEDRDSSTIELISQQLTSATLGDALKLLVQPNKFQVETASMDLLPTARDLVYGTFKILSHCPITALGMNRHMHFRMHSEDAWHRVGHELAPKSKWEGLVDQPGLLSLQVQGHRQDSSAQRLRVTLEPSTKVKPGVYVGVNEHYASGDDFMQILADELEPSQTYARTLADQIIERCLKEGD